MKRILTALAVLVILAVVAVLVYRPEEKPAETPPLPALAASDIQWIEIERTEGAVSGGKKFHAVLEKKGNEWTMTQPVSYPANQEVVSELANKIASFQPVDLVASSAALHLDYELTRDLGVTVTAKAGDRTLKVVLGVMKNGHTFARLPDEDRVFRMPGMVRSAFGQSLSNFRDKTLLKLPEKRIDRIRFVNEHGAFEVTRGPDGWVPVGKPIKNFDEEKFNSLVTMIADLKTRDFMDGSPTIEESGFTDQASRVVIHVAAAEALGDAGAGAPSEEHTLVLGNDEKNTRTVYCKLDQNPQAFLLAQHQATRLRPKADDYARTDEQVKKAAEAKAKRNAQALADPSAPLDGTGGTFIRPEFRDEFRKQMMQKRAVPPPQEK